MANGLTKSLRTVYARKQIRAIYLFNKCMPILVLRIPVILSKKIDLTLSKTTLGVFLSPFSRSFLCIATKEHTSIFSSVVSPVRLTNVIYFWYTYFGDYFEINFFFTQNTYTLEVSVCLWLNFPWFTMCIQFSCEGFFWLLPQKECTN